MRKSESIKEIATALCEFQAECPKVEKTKTVIVKTKAGSYSFSYADIDEITTKIKPTMAKCKLSYSQIPESDGSVTTILMHSSGEWIEGNLSILPEGSKVGPQDIGSAITYAKRYALSSMLGIVADEDDDGNTASGNSYSYGKKRRDLKEIIEDMKGGNDLETINKYKEEAKDKGLTERQEAWFNREYNKKYKELVENTEISNNDKENLPF